MAPVARLVLLVMTLVSASAWKQKQSDDYSDDSICAADQCMKHAPGSPVEEDTSCCGAHNDGETPSCKTGYTYAGQTNQDANCLWDDHAGCGTLCTCCVEETLASACGITSADYDRCTSTDNTGAGSITVGKGGRVWPNPECHKDEFTSSWVSADVCSIGDAWMTGVSFNSPTDGTNSEGVAFDFYAEYLCCDSDPGAGKPVDMIRAQPVACENGCMPPCDYNGPSCGPDGMPMITIDEPPMITIDEPPPAAAAASAASTTNTAVAWVIMLVMTGLSQYLL